MTATIDGIVITGTPQEIASFLKFYKTPSPSIGTAPQPWHHPGTIFTPALPYQPTKVPKGPWSTIGKATA